MSASRPVPSLLNLSIDRAAANIDRLVTLSFIPDHIVAILFEKTLKASKLNDSILKIFLATGNSYVRKRVKDLGIRPTERPVLPTSESPVISPCRGILLVQEEYFDLACPGTMTTTSASTAVASMRTIKLKPEILTPESLKPYGQVVGPCSDGQKFDCTDAQLDLSHGIPRFYIMHLKGQKRLTFGNITHHASVTQCLGSIGGHSWYLGVAAASIVQDQDNDLVLESGASDVQTAEKRVHAIRSKSRHYYVPPSPEDVKVFRVDGPLFLKLHMGTWHAGPLFTHDSMDFYNLELSDTNEVDFTTHSFRKQDQVVFEIDDQ